MRFPHIPLMDRTFDLFKRLDFTLENKKLDIYHLSTPTDICLYNDIVAPSSAPAADDIHKFGVKNGGTVPESFVQQGYSHWIGEKIDWLRDELRKDFHGKGWDALMSVDEHTMRSYMSMVEPKYPNAVRHSS